MTVEGEYVPSVPHQPDDKVLTGNDLWCTEGGLLHDFMVSAQKAADVTGRFQTIHMHAAADPCVGIVHHTIQPDPVRTVAVGGPEHQ